MVTEPLHYGQLEKAWYETFKQDERIVSALGHYVAGRIKEATAELRNEQCQRDLKHQQEAKASQWGKQVYERLTYLLALEGESVMKRGKKSESRTIELHATKKASTTRKATKMKNVPLDQLPTAYAAINKKDEEREKLGRGKKTRTVVHAPEIKHTEEKDTVEFATDYPHSLPSADSSTSPSPAELITRQREASGLARAPLSVVDLTTELGELCREDVCRVVAVMQGERGLKSAQWCKKATESEKDNKFVVEDDDGAEYEIYKRWYFRTQSAADNFRAAIGVLGVFSTDIPAKELPQGGLKKG